MRSRNQAQLSGWNGLPVGMGGFVDFLPFLDKRDWRRWDLFGTNRGPRPSVDGLVSVDGLGMAGHTRISRMAWPPSLNYKMKTFWVIKYLNIYSTNKCCVQKRCRFMRRFTSNSPIYNMINRH